MDIKIFSKNRAFTFSNIATFLNYSPTFAIGFLLSLYLQYIRGLSPQHAGAILMVQPAIQTVLSPFAGWLSDKIEPRTVASFGIGMILLGLILLFSLKESTTLIFIIAGLLVLGAGFAFFSSPNTNAIMCSVSRRFYGTASAFLATMRLTGQMFSMVLVMFVFSVLMGSAGIYEAKEKFLASMKISFILFILICVIGLYFSIARGKIKTSLKTEFEI